MFKITISTILLLLSQSLYAATATVDFLVGVTDRYTSLNNSWLKDSNFSGQEFTLSVTFDSANYNPGVLDYWDGQDVTFIYPEITSVSFSATPFDEELNAVQPVLDYYGNIESSSLGASFGEVSYNGTFDSGTILQSFGQNQSVLYYDSTTGYIADFDRNIRIEFADYNANLTVADVVPLSFEEYINLGYGQTYDFYQSVEEDYNDDWFGSGSWITLDGGIRYQGTATVSNITVVPIPATVWLFGSGLIGLLGAVRKVRRVD